MELKNTRQVEAIENNIKIILSEGKSFNDDNENFRKLLKEINEDLKELHKTRTELINYLLNHSKRKILFKYTRKKKGDYGSNTYFEVGLNPSGIGLVQGNWEHNLRNISEYWVESNFAELLQEPDFLKQLLKEVNTHLKGKHKAIMKLLFTPENEIEGIRKSKEVIVNGIKISIKVDDYSSVRYYEADDKSRYSESISILYAKGDEDNQDSDDDDLLDFDFSFQALRKYCLLINSKKEIKKALHQEFKNYQKIHKKIKIKLAKVEKELKPFKALQQI